LSCRGELLEKFVNQKKDLDFIKKNQVSLVIISIIFLVVISIALTGVSCANIFGYDWPCISGKGTEESNIIFRIEAIFKAII
jgi:hypothetical protein